MYISAHTPEHKVPEFPLLKVEITTIWRYGNKWGKKKKKKKRLTVGSRASGVVLSTVPGTV